MSHRPVQAFSVSLASGLTTTSALDLSKSYQNISIAIPTMTSGTDIYFQGSDTIDGTFRRIYNVATSSTPAAVFLNSSITQAVVKLPLNVQYLKVELSTAMTATAVQFKVLCSD